MVSAALELVTDSSLGDGVAFVGEPTYQRPHVRREIPGIIQQRKEAGLGGDAREFAYRSKMEIEWKLLRVGEEQVRAEGKFEFLVGEGQHR